MARCLNSYYDDNNSDDDSWVSNDESCSDSEDDGSATTLDLISLDDESDNESNCGSWDSESDLLSYDSSVDLSESSRIYRNDSGRLNLLSSILPSAPQVPVKRIEVVTPLYIPSQIMSESLVTDTRYKRHTQPLASSYFDGASMSTKSTHSKERANDMGLGSGLEFGSYTVPHIEDASLDSCRSTLAGSDPSQFEGKKRALSMMSTDTTTASTTLLSSDWYSNSSSDEMPSCCEESVPYAVRFANQCLERSRTRRSSETLSIPTSLTHPIARQKSTPSNPSQALKCIAESQASSNASISSQASSTTSLSVNSMYETFSQSSLCRRVEQMHMKLKSMQIRHCHQKCMSSLRKSMVLYMKVDTPNDDDDSTICTIESCCAMPNSHLSFRNKAASKRKCISQVAKEVLCFNLIFAIIWMMLLLYKGSILTEIDETYIRFFLGETA